VGPLWLGLLALLEPAAQPAPAWEGTVLAAAQDDPQGEDWGDDLLGPSAPKKKPTPKPGDKKPDGKKPGDKKPGDKKPGPEEHEADLEDSPFLDIPPVDLVPPPEQPADKPGAPALEEPPEPGRAEKPGPRKKPAPAEEPAPAGEPAPAEEPARPPEPSPSKDSSPRAEPAASSPEEEDKDPNFLVDLDGGVMILRGARFQGLAGFGLGWNLGKVLGWPGLFLKADLDMVIGRSALGAEYLMFDALFGFLARFHLGPVCLLVDLDFGLRHLAVTQEAAGTPTPVAGFGASGGLGLEVPLTDLFSLHLGADARYMRDPLTQRFEFSTALMAGVGFVF